MYCTKIQIPRKRRVCTISLFYGLRFVLITTGTRTSISPLSHSFVLFEHYFTVFFIFFFQNKYPVPRSIPYRLGKGCAAHAYGCHRRALIVLISSWDRSRSRKFLRASLPRRTRLEEFSTREYGVFGFCFFFFRCSKRLTE